MKSRYQSARLVNRELILLYLDIGRKISTMAIKEAWGSKVIDQISDPLQNERPGLCGFSTSNCKKMRVFAEFWNRPLKISSATPNQLENSGEINTTHSPNNFCLAPELN